MGIGAAFWTGLGSPALWYDLSSFTDGFNVGVNADGTREMLVGPCRIYQEPSTVGGSQNRVQDNPGYDSGFFYAQEINTGEQVRCHAIFLVGVPYLVATPHNAQWVRLQPYCQAGDLIPKTTSASTTTYFDKNPLYKTGFIKNYDAANPAYQYSGQDVALQIHIENKSGDWRLHHYNPYAWFGTPPEVIAAAAMYAGLSSSDIDQAAFDNAHDAYDLTTGDSPWADLDTKWTIYASRIVGQNVAKFLLECAEHSRDFIFVNESGKLSVSSFTRPLFSATGLSLDGDQLIDVVSWTITLDHVFNSVRAGWGAAARQSWEDTDGYTGSRPGSTEMSVSFEPNLESRPGDKWTHDKEHATSVAAYGRRWLKGKKVVTNFRGQPQEVAISHYPFLLTPHVTMADVFNWDESTDGGGMVHVTNWLNSDSKPRAVLEIKQGPMGFDLAIGDKISNLAITGDGQTIDEAIIIERKYDFDAKTVESGLLEIPDNTYRRRELCSNSELSRRMEDLTGALETTNKKIDLATTGLTKISTRLETWEQTTCRAHEVQIKDLYEKVSVAKDIATSAAFKAAALFTVGLGVVGGILTWAVRSAIGL